MAMSKVCFAAMVLASSVGQTQASCGCKQEVIIEKVIIKGPTYAAPYSNHSDYNASDIYVNVNGSSYGYPGGDINVSGSVNLIVDDTIDLVIPEDKIPVNLHADPLCLDENATVEAEGTLPVCLEDKKVWIENTEVSATIPDINVNVTVNEIAPFEVEVSGNVTLEHAYVTLHEATVELNAPAITGALTLEPSCPDNYQTLDPYAFPGNQTCRYTSIPSLKDYFKSSMKKYLTGGGYTSDKFSPLLSVCESYFIGGEEDISDSTGWYHNLCCPCGYKVVACRDELKSKLLSVELERTTTTKDPETEEVCHEMPELYIACPPADAAISDRWLVRLWEKKAIPMTIGMLSVRNAAVKSRADGHIPSQ